MQKCVRRSQCMDQLPEFCAVQSPPWARDRHILVQSLLLQLSNIWRGDCIRAPSTFATQPRVAPRRADVHLEIVLKTLCIFQSRAILAFAAALPQKQGSCTGLW